MSNTNGGANVPDGPFDDGGPEGEYPPAFSLDIRAMLAVLRRNIILFGIIVASVLIIGLVITLLMTPTYSATASVQIDQQSDQILSNDNVQPAVGYQDADRFLNTQADILRSRAMAVRVANQLNLFTPAFFNAMGEKAPEPVLGRSPVQALQNGTIALLERNLTITLPTNSRVATISFNSPDAHLAARVANGYAVAFIRNNLQRKYDSSAYARDFLGNQLVEAKARLEQAEIQLNQYGRAAGLIDTSRAATLRDGTSSSASGGGSSITASSLVQLNQAANQAKADRIAAEGRWRVAQATPMMSIRGVLQNSAFQSLQQQRAIAEANLDQELTHHRDEYPTVVQARSYLQALDGQIKALAGTIRKSIQDEYRAAVDQERALDAQVNGLKSATLGEQDRSVRYNILAREVDTSRTLYDGLLQRYKELSATAGATTNNVSLVDNAEPPSAPYSPRLALNMALAALAGIAAGLAVVFLREQFDDVVRTPDDVERKLGVSVLGTIPQPESKETVLESLDVPRSPVAEAYYALRTSLLHSTSEGLPRSVLVTSSQPGEGKSTTSFALASDLARVGRNVLLIDTDLRRPSLHRVLGKPNTVGLSTLLTAQAGNVIQTTDIPNLSFISSGPIPPNPTELLGGDRLLDMIRDFESRFDTVILDGPPVLGLADAPMLSTVARAVLFVVEARLSHHGGAKTALRRLRMTRSRLLGAVLTKFDPRAAGLGGSYGYEYYRYGPED